MKGVLVLPLIFGARVMYQSFQMKPVKVLLQFIKSHIYIQETVQNVLRPPKGTNQEPFGPILTNVYQLEPIRIN